MAHSLWVTGTYDAPPLGGDHGGRRPLVLLDLHGLLLRILPVLLRVLPVLLATLRRREGVGVVVAVGSTTRALRLRTKKKRGRERKGERGWKVDEANFPPRGPPTPVRILRLRRIRSPCLVAECCRP